MAMTARLLPRFPARVQVSDGLTKEYANGVLSLGFDPTQSEAWATIEASADAAEENAAAAAASETAAEAAQTAAEDARDDAEGYAESAALATNQAIYADRDALAAATVAAPVTKVYVQYFDKDFPEARGGAWYVEVAVPGDPTLRHVLSNGATRAWEIETGTQVIFTAMLGARDGQDCEDAVREWADIGGNIFASPITHLVNPDADGPIEFPVASHVRGTRGKHSFKAGAMAAGENVADTGLAVLFAPKADDITFDGIKVDGDGSEGVTATATHIAFEPGLDGVSYKRLRFINCDVVNWRYSDGNTGYDNAVASHAIRANYTDEIVIKGCWFEDVWGCPTFLYSVTDFKIQRNRYINAVWYPVCCYTDCHFGVIELNKFEGDDSFATFWGGAINVFSQPPFEQSSDITIRRNKITGYYGYEHALRVASGKNITVEDNSISDWFIATVNAATINGADSSTAGMNISTRTTQISTLAEDIATTATVTDVAITSSANFSMNEGTPYYLKIDSEWVLAVARTGFHPNPTTSIDITARGQNGTVAATHSNGDEIYDANDPCENVVIKNNFIEAPGNTQTHAESFIGVMLLNAGRLTRVPAIKIDVTNNEMRQNPNGTNFACAVYVDGGKCGFEKIDLIRNAGDTEIITGGLAGAITVTATNSDGVVNDGSEYGNRFTDRGVGSNDRAFFSADYISDWKFGPSTATNYKKARTIGLNSAGPFYDPYTVNMLSPHSTGPRYGSITPASDSLIYTDTTTNLNLQSAAINADGKYTGKAVFSSAGKKVFASGTTAASVWVDSTGATAYTPV